MDLLKTLSLAAVAVAAAMFMSCGNRSGSSAASGDNVAAEASNAGDDVQDFDFKCSIEGDISHDTWDASQSATVTFPRFPQSMAEFEAAYRQLSGEPQGVVALQVMAFDLYRQDRAIGEQALKKINTEVNYTQTLRQLKQIMNADDVYYARPYLASALLKGATPENGYTPDSPYTVQVYVNPVSRYQESEMLGGTVIYLQVDSKGWDTNRRGVEVVKPEGSGSYLVSNCPSLYTQCKKAKSR